MPREPDFAWLRERWVELRELLFPRPDLPIGTERVRWRTVLERAVEKFAASSPGRLGLAVKLEAQNAWVRCSGDVLEASLATLLEAMAAFTPAGRSAAVAVIDEEQVGHDVLTFTLTSLEVGARLCEAKSIVGQFGWFGWRLAVERRRIEACGGSLSGARGEGRTAGAAFRLSLRLAGRD